jgi:hypothetical protein
VTRPFIPFVTAICWLGLAYKLTDLYRRRFDHALRCLCVTLAGAALSMTAQQVAAPLDVHTGIPNLGRLVSNAAALVAICGAQTFLIYVTRGPDAARPLVARRYAALAVCLATIAVLFALTPADRDTSAASPLHFHKIYNSPYIWVYLGYLGYGLTDVARYAWHYARISTRPYLRMAMWLAGIGGACGLVYALLRGVFLAADEAGYGLPTAEADTAGPLYLITTTILLVATTLPAWGPRLTALGHWYRSRQQLRQLRPLWMALHTAYPHLALLPPTTAIADALDPRDVPLRLYRRVIEIRDGLLTLRPHLAPGLAPAAQRLAEQAGLTGQNREAATHAALIAAALAARADGASQTDSQELPPDPSPTDTVAEIAWLTAVSRAFARMPRAQQAPKACPRWSPLRPPNLVKRTLRDLFGGTDQPVR